MKPTAIVKRDGTEVPFDLSRISGAIIKALHAVGTDDRALAAEMATVVLEHLERHSDQSRLGIEEVQDAVVHVLQESGYYDAARAYIRYRDERERFRRERRILREGDARLNLTVVDLDGRRRRWDRGWIGEHLAERYQLERKAIDDALIQVESFLSGTATDTLSAPLLLSLVDAALVRCGMHTVAEERAPLRLDRTSVRAALSEAADGAEALVRCGQHAFAQLSLSESYPEQVVRQFCKGRLWIDGLTDPRRGSQYTATVGRGTPTPGPCSPPPSRSRPRPSAAGGACAWCCRPASSGTSSAGPPPWSSPSPRSRGSRRCSSIAMDGRRCSAPGPSPPPR